jgi:zinc protease
MRIVCAVLIALLPAVVVAKSQNMSAAKAKMWQLDNGLKVIFVEEHKAPVVAVQVFYHVGGKDEPADKRGIAHMFEHMMFKGSKNLGPEEHARIIDSFGGNNNAFTMDDVTAYQNTVPPAALSFTLKLEAERMRNLTLTQKTIDSEREVVKEELRVRLENSPIAQALDKVLHVAYEKHPYRQSPIGEKKMLDTVTIQDCEKFYDMFYRPNNATLIVVGDTDEASLRKMVDEHFGSLKAGAPAKHNEIKEPAQTKLREATLELSVQLPVMIGAYHIPQGSDADIFVFDVIQQILSGGESSRLYKRLVKKEQLALFAGGVVFNHADPGLFVTYAAYLPNKDAKKIRNILEEEIGMLKTGKLNERELQKAKNQLAAQTVFAQERVTGIATQIGVDEIVSKNPLHSFSASAKYDAVSIADVQRVARKYFIESNYSIVTLLPKMGAK